MLERRGTWNFEQDHIQLNQTIKNTYLGCWEGTAEGTALMEKQSQNVREEESQPVQVSEMIEIHTWVVHLVAWRAFLRERHWKCKHKMYEMMVEEAS